MHLSYVNVFNWVTLISGQASSPHFTEEDVGGLERGSHLPEVMQLVRGRAQAPGLHVWRFDSRAHPGHCTVLPCLLFALITAR